MVMMKLLAIVGACALAVAVAYTDLDDSFDYDAVAKNTTELRHHLYCFLDKEPCSDVAQHYKNHILDAVLNDCKDCTAVHKHKAHAFLRAVIKKFPEGYAELREKYDPEGTLFDNMESELDKY